VLLAVESEVSDRSIEGSQHDFENLREQFSRCDPKVLARELRNFLSGAALQNGPTITLMTSMGPNFEIAILEEKLRALNALVRYEGQPEKLHVYKRDLALVANELNDARRAVKNQWLCASACNRP
jgi:hypothetical protein